MIQWHLLWPTWVTFNWLQNRYGMVYSTKTFTNDNSSLLIFTTKTNGSTTWITSEYSLALRSTQRLKTKILTLCTQYYHTEMKERDYS